MDILDDMGVSKFSAKVFFKVIYSFKWANTHSSQIFLGEALILAAQLDHFPHFKRNSLVTQLLSLSVQLGCVLGYNMLFILPSSPLKK